MKPGLILLILLRLVASVHSAEPILQEVRAIQAAATVEPFLETEVAASGVVTWADPASGKYFYIQDQTGGVQVTYESGPGPKTGEKVRVRGTLTRGPFAPVIARAAFTSMGAGTLPEVMQASGGGLLNGSFNGEWIETDGWIRAAEMTGPNTMSAVLDSGASRITFRVSHVNHLNPHDIIAAKARVIGVASPVRSRGALRQLVEVQVLVPRESLVMLGQRESKSPWAAPPVPLRTAFQYRPGQTRGDRVRVRGKVMLLNDGMAWLNDGESGLAVRGPELVHAQRGDWVDILGFRDLEDFLPVLSDVVMLPDRNPVVPVVPREMPVDGLEDGLQHAGYVAVTGELMDLIQTPSGMAGSHLVLALQSPRGIFTAELADGPATTAMAAALEPGSQLRVAGICVTQTNMSGEPAGFKLLLPDAAAVSVVKAAPYFTVKRLLILLSIALGVLFAAALTALFLARRNVRLRAQMLERRAITAERSRLARDLHDTLEQGLAGIHLQLHAIGPSLDEASSETQERLATVRHLVHQCHAEMRQSIWNLRAEALEHFDLGEALHRAAQSVFLGTCTQVEFHQQRDGGKIPPLVEDNLLRIGQEAMTNALKHARATLLRITLTSTAQSAVLTVIDNGRGFTSQSGDSSASGRFGLVGMRERAARIGGKIRIHSQPGDGTSIRVEVPLTPSFTHATDSHETQPSG